MKANELRIGNWVKAKGILCPIALISESHIRVRLAEREAAINKDEMDPIPLTPEVLEKCGYKIYEGTSDEIRAGRLVMQFALYKQGYKVNVFIGGEYLGFREYLHQLQNLFYSLRETELIYTP